MQNSKSYDISYEIQRETEIPNCELRNSAKTKNESGKTKEQTIKNVDWESLSTEYL